MTPCCSSCLGGFAWGEPGNAYGPPMQPLSSNAIWICHCEMGKTLLCYAEFLKDDARQNDVKLGNGKFLGSRIPCVAHIQDI